MTLIRLGACPGCSESSLGAQSFCLFCREAAHMTISSDKATVWTILETISGLGFSLEKVQRMTYSFTTVAYYNSLLKIFKGF